MEKTQDLIQNLIQEHEAIKSVLGIISNIVDNSNTKMVYSIEDIELAIDFVNEFVSKNHYSKEEILFHEASINTTEAENEVLSDLIIDHKNETVILSEIIVALEKCKSISPVSLEEITENLKKYVNMLQVHLSQEENFIFPFIKKILPEELQLELIRMFEAVEKRVFTKTSISAYYEIKNQLNEKHIKKEEQILF